jgi:hypothetical protein
MRTCEEFGSTNVVVRVPVEHVYVQERDGKWTDRGLEGVDEKALWYCGECDHSWHEWFTEAADRR